MSARPIQEILEEHTDRWMDMPGVVGTAIGESDGQPCIKVFVTEKSDRLRQKIPADLEGYRVVLEETGEFRAL
jgi:hypothetical protein